MAASVKDVMLYFCRNYPHKSELSKARLTKMVYLADWRSSILRDRQLTDIRWEFHNYGPYVDDIKKIAIADDDFTLEHGWNLHGSRKTTIYLNEDSTAQLDSLTSKDIEILDHVIEKTRRLSFDGFVQLVYSTYPIMTQPRYQYLNLPALARKYIDSIPL